MTENAHPGSTARNVIRYCAVTGKIPLWTGKLGVCGRFGTHDRKAISQVRSIRVAATTHAAADDPNLGSHAGLVPAARLAEYVCLEEPVAERSHGGADPDLTIGSPSVGMFAGVDTGCLA
jgi:hypothetical protein